MLPFFWLLFVNFGGLEVLFDYIYPSVNLVDKTFVIVRFFSLVIAFSILITRQWLVSKILLLSCIAITLVMGILFIREVLIFGGADTILFLNFYFLLILVPVLQAYCTKYDVNFFFFASAVISNRQNSTH